MEPRGAGLGRGRRTAGEVFGVIHGSSFRHVGSSDVPKWRDKWMQDRGNLLGSRTAGSAADTLDADPDVLGVPENAELGDAHSRARRVEVRQAHACEPVGG